MKKNNIYRIFEEQYGINKTAQYNEPSLLIRLLQIHSKNRLKVISDILFLKKDMTVLDIGCGDGTFLFENRKKWKRIIGVDIIKQQLKKAQARNYGKPAQFMQKDFGRTKMPFKNNSFDLCVSIATLQYIYDLDLLFQEINRVLKQDGLWICEVPNIAVFWRRIQFFLGKMPKTSQFANGWDAGVIHYFTVENVKNFCKEKNFCIESITCSGVFQQIRRLWVSVLGADIIFVCRKK